MTRRGYTQLNTDTPELNRSQDQTRDIAKSLQTQIDDQQVRYVFTPLTAAVDSTATGVSIKELETLVRSGRYYRITFTARFICTAGDTVVVDVIDEGIDFGSNIVLRLSFENSGAGTQESSHGASVIHKMVGSSLTVVPSSITSGSSIAGSTTVPVTYLMVEELPNHLEVDQF